MTDISGYLVRRGYTDEFTRCNDLSLLPELRKMPAVSRDQVIRTGSIGRIPESVVVRITAHVQAARRDDDMPAVLNELEQHIPYISAYD
jgi:hypothetical protein